ncbi:alpha/beta fold hydrolase [Candidatus Woesearchaeota archaeon]|nr:alpha/beta fold hydrolase [Candidatus Woesearchaeota archaeon]
MPRKSGSEAKVRALAWPFGRRVRLRFFSVAAAVFLFTSVVAVVVMVDYLATESLVVYLRPSQTSFHANYGNVTNISFLLGADTRMFCTVECNYSFRDIGKGAVIDNGTVRIGRGESVVRNYSLGLSRRGTGQFLYGFETECVNLDSFGCISGNGQKIASSIVTLNYNYTEAELALKGGLGRALALHLGEVDGVYVESQKVLGQVAALEEVTRLRELLPVKAELNDHVQFLVLEAEAFRALWKEEDYGLLNVKFMHRTVPSPLLVSRLRQLAEAQVAEHDRLVGMLRSFNYSYELGYVLSVADARGIPELRSDVLGASSALSGLAGRFLRLEYENYSQVLDELETVNQSFSGSYVNASRLSDFVVSESVSLIEREKEQACRLKDFCTGSPVVPAFSSVSGKMGFACSEVGRWVDDLGNASFYYAARSVGFSLNGSEAYNSLYSSLGVGSLLASPDFAAGLQELYFNMSNNLSLSDNLTLRFFANLSSVSSAGAFLDRYCSAPHGFSALNITLGKISVPAPSGDFLRINTTLDEPVPVCCVFGECAPCCTGPLCSGDSRTYPVVFVHGHSVSRYNPPEFMPDSFLELQKELEAEGYINAGILYMDSSQGVASGDWGISGKPVTVSLSYYYDTLRDGTGRYVLVPRKSSGIESYAIRLKDLIEEVRRRTGKEKVVIVAHSMGGLVSRSYIQIFGEAHVDKLVMLNTPNHGVNSTAGSLCNVLGEQMECADMDSGSFFLRKLNSAGNPGISVHNIVGIGCVTGGGDGDGVVPRSSAYLGFAQNYYVMGSCSAFDRRVAHTEMVSPDKYPEVARIIKRVLQS